jgi:hypothetical protein
MRLPHGGSAARSGVAIYRAGRDDDQDSFLPTGTPKGALDCAAGRDLNDPTAWMKPDEYTNPATSATDRPSPTDTPTYR